MITELGAKPETPLSSRIIPKGKETIMDLIIRFSWDESGSPAVEYALLLGFIAVAILASFNTFCNTITNVFNDATAKYPTSGS